MHTKSVCTSKRSADILTEPYKPKILKTSHWLSDTFAKFDQTSI